MAWKASPLRKKAGLMRAPPANRIAIRTSSPSSHPPTSWAGMRPILACTLSDIGPQALADVFDVSLGHQLRPGVQIGGRDAAIDLEIELHHRPEALQERLLAERAGQVAGADGVLLHRSEVEAIGTDLSGLPQLRDRLGEGGREHVVGGEGADHVAA